MIPKRALFYWDHKSPEVSWLRMQSMVTFARLNPDWEIVTLDGKNAPGEIQGDDYTSQVLRSDFCRYEALHDLGGMYFDTDIVFTKPIPEVWLSKDVALSIENGHSCGIAILGSAQGSPFFASVMAKCLQRIVEPVILAYQSLGVKVFHSIDIYSTLGAMNLGLTIIPKESHLIVQWGMVEKLWSPIKVHMPTHAIGLHWFGGDRMSQEYEKKFDDPEFRRTAQCPVADALGELVERAA